MLLSGACATAAAAGVETRLRQQELTLDSGPSCRTEVSTVPHGLHFGYLTRLRRLTLRHRVVYGLQASWTASAIRPDPGPGMSLRHRLPPHARTRLPRLDFAPDSCCPCCSCT